MLRRAAVLTLSGVLGLAPAAMAQDQNSPEQNKQNTPEQQEETKQPQDEAQETTAKRVTPEDRPSAEQQLTQQLAAWLATCNQAEIELAKFAQERTTTPQVEQFATTLIDEHQKQLDKLQGFMPAASLKTGDESNLEQPKLSAKAAKGHDKMQQIAMEASRNKVAMTKQVLGDYRGQDFDMGFLGQQIVAHTDMLAILHAVKDEGSSEFQQAVNDAIPTIEQHFVQAEKLSRQFQDREQLGDATGQPAEGATEPAEQPADAADGQPADTPATPAEADAAEDAVIVDDATEAAEEDSDALERAAEPPADR